MPGAEAARVDKPKLVCVNCHDCDRANWTFGLNNEPLDDRMRLCLDCQYDWGKGGSMAILVLVTLRMTNLAEHILMSLWPEYKASRFYQDCRRLYVKGDHKFNAQVRKILLAEYGYEE